MLGVTGDEERPAKNDCVKGEKGGGCSADFAHIEHVVVFVDEGRGVAGCMGAAEGSLEGAHEGSDWSR